MLSQQDTQRYSRQIMLDEIGYEGQIKLGNATATVVGQAGWARRSCRGLPAWVSEILG